MGLQVPKAMWVLRESQALQDSRETRGHRGSPAPRDSSGLLGRRALLEMQGFRAPQELTVLRVTRARRAPRERRGPRAQRGRQVLRATRALEA